MLEAVKRRIDRTLFEFKGIFRCGFDGLRNGVPVRRANNKRAQNEQVESSPASGSLFTGIR